MRRLPASPLPPGLLQGLTLALGLCMLPAGTRAEPAAASLAQAFESAWQQQPEARSAQDRRQAAAGRQAQARRWTAQPPALQLSAKTDRWSRDSGAREQELGLSLPLWLPGERERSMALADAERQGLDSREAAARWRLAGELREAWWSVHKARAELELAQAREQSAARLAADVGRRVAAGELARADRLLADGAQVAAQAEQALARATVVQAEQALAALTRQPVPAELPDQPEALPDAQSEPAAPELPPLHPQLRELDDRLASAERARELTQSQRRPNPELSLSTTRERGAYGDRYGQNLGLALRIPFGSDGERQNRESLAQAEQQEARAALELTRQRLIGELAAARARLAAARLAEQAAGRRAELAQATLGFVEKSFRAGETDLPGRLRVELEAFEAQRQALLARLALNQSISALHQALGLLPR